MFCTKCGQQNTDGTGFCVKCGQPLGQSAPQPQQQAYAPPQQPQQPMYAPPPGYMPPPRPPRGPGMAPQTKKWLIIGSAAAVVIAVVLLLVFLIPGNALVGRWYGSYGVQVDFRNGGTGTVSTDAFGANTSLDFKYEITYQEEGYIEGVVISQFGEEADFWYEEYRGEAELNIEGESYSREKPEDFDMDFDFDF